MICYTALADWNNHQACKGHDTTNDSPGSRVGFHANPGESWSHGRGRQWEKMERSPECWEIKPKQKIPFVPYRSERTLKRFVKVSDTLRRMVVYETLRIGCCENQNCIPFGNLSFFLVSSPSWSLHMVMNGYNMRYGSKHQYKRPPSCCLPIGLWRCLFRSGTDMAGSSLQLLILLFTPSLYTKVKVNSSPIEVGRSSE